MPCPPTDRSSRPTLPLVLLGGLLLSAAPAMAQQPGPSTTPPPSAAPQQPANAKGGGQPVEIVADSLTVEQDKQLATFTGNVDAVQGNMRLRADKLLVYYERAANGGDSPQQADSQGIRRIEAIGNVFLTQPGQTAKGDHGTYEPASGEVTLDGNVVLTRNQNVVRGARLVSNQRTGVSTVFAAEPGATGKPDQRVRALFAPEKKANAANGSKTPSP